MSQRQTVNSDQSNSNTEIPKDAPLEKNLKQLPNEIPVIGEMADSSPTKGTVHYQEIHQAQRMISATKALMICWAVAGFCVFIPILHFVLVPGFFLLGVFMGINKYVDDKQIAGGNVPCKCGSEVAISSRLDRFPFFVSCQKCNIEIKVLKA